MDGWFCEISVTHWMDGWMDGWMGWGILIHPLVGWMDGLSLFIHSSIHSSSSVSQKKRQPASPETLASPVRSLACSLAGWLAGPLARSLARVFATYALCTTAALSLLSSFTKQTHLCIPENRLTFPPLALSGGIPVLLFHSVLCHTRLRCPFGVFCMRVW
jgi:hypothetical protein